jgi:hypothetical protein
MPCWRWTAPPFTEAASDWLAYGADGRRIRRLARALDGTREADNRLWLLTRLGEVAAWRGQPEAAERHFRAALALGIEDGYLLAAWSDFLLDQQRPAEVVKALAGWEASDGLLLRLAIAGTALKLPAAKAAVQALADRFAAAKVRGDTTHRPKRPLPHAPGRRSGRAAVAPPTTGAARAPRRPVLLEAAIAARDAGAAQPVRDWLRSSGFEDPHLRQLGLASAP